MGIRRLNNNKPKETRKQKLDRRADYARIKKQFNTIVLPSIIAIVVVILIFVYIRSRPSYYATSI